jgi:hypothetical protein
MTFTSHRADIGIEPASPEAISCVLFWRGVAVAVAYGPHRALYRHAPDHTNMSCGYHAKCLAVVGAGQEHPGPARCGSSVSKLHEDPGVGEG